MARKFFFVSAGIVSLAIAVHFGALSAQAQSSRVALQSSGVGRFQIVNGTPTMTRNIMLLDTQAGTSWVFCTGHNGADTWCVIPRSMAMTAGEADSSK
jgi:hypothetical protein